MTNADHPDRRWFTLATMCIALFMIMLDNTVVNVALPSIQRAFNPSAESLEWTINAYVLTFAVLILTGGKLGDRFGRRKLFIVGLGVFTLASAMCALAQSDNQLIAFRAFQGVGGAIMNPLTLSILVAAFPRKQLPTAIGIWAGISGLGLAIGPLLGGYLVDHAGWSYVFWINIPVGIVAVVAALLFVDESRDPTTTSIDLLGTVLITGSLFALVFGLIKTGTHSFGSPLILELLIASVVLFVAFLVWESRTLNPMIPLEFFRVRMFSISVVVVILVGFAMFGSIYFLSLYFQNVQSLNALQSGLRSLPLTAMIVICAPIAGRVNGRYGPRWLMVLGMAFASIGMFGLSRLGVSTSYNAIWPFYMLLGAGISLTMPSVSSAAMGSVDPRKAGIASGVVNAGRQVGGSVGLAVLGAVAAAVSADHWRATLTSAQTRGPLNSDRVLQAVQSANGTRLVAGLQKAGFPLGDATAFRHDISASFVSGLDRAMFVGGSLTLIAGVAAAVGLHGLRVAQHTPAEKPAEQQPVIAVEA